MLQAQDWLWTPGHEMYPISDKCSNYVRSKYNGINWLPGKRRREGEWTPGGGQIQAPSATEWELCRPVLDEGECAFWQEEFSGSFPA